MAFHVGFIIGNRTSHHEKEQFLIFSDNGVLFHIKMH